MKNRLYRLLTPALALLIGFTSCLKDDNIDDQEYGLIDLNANKIIEIPANASHQKSITLMPEGITEVTVGTVRLAAEDPAAEDIVVSLTTAESPQYVDPDAMFPLDEITVPATVTIPKGERSAPLVVSINTALLLSDPQYVAISVSSVDKDGYTISGNFGHLILNMKIKHRYEGLYHLASGTLIEPNHPEWGHVTNLDDAYDVQLQTVDGQTIALYDDVYVGGNYYLFDAGGGLSYFGSFCPQFTFDDEGNITAVTNVYGQPAANSRSCEIDPAGVNKYDPQTNSFTVSYWMNQSGYDPHRLHIEETYVYVEDL